MRNIYNEEKSLKRYLKNHVSLNLETMVKFLITGMIGVSLTACGGGGGGGSSSDSKPPVVGPEDPKPEPPVIPPEVEVNKNNETHEVTNSNSVITGTITGTQDNFTALKAVNSTVENKAEISVEGNNTVAIHGTTDVARLSSREKHTITNNGNIKVKGDNSTGILIENGVVGINNKKITVTGNESSGMVANGNGSEVINKGDILVEGNGDYLTDSEGNVIKNKAGSTGISANDGAIGVNDGNIEAKGSANIGMYAKNATIINNGNIETNSTVKYIDDSYMDGDNFIEERGIGFSYETAMEGRENSYVENNGTIVGTGSVFGMVARTGSTAVNKGDIEITGKVQKYEGSEDVLYDDDGRLNKNMISFSTGIRGTGKTEVSNEGNISIIGGDGIGVDARTESVGKNSGNIYLEGSEFVAKGIWIDEDGEKYEEDYTTYTWTTGMRSRDNSIVTNEENGNITIKGTGTALQARRNSEAINKGNINLESIEYIGTYTWTNEDGEKETATDIQHTWVSGMQIIEGSKGINDSSIYLKGSGSGINIHDESEGINNGSIYGESILYKDDKYSNLTYITGMEVNDNSYGENNGLISLIGQGEGMQARENSEIVNNGTIQMQGITAAAEGADHEATSYLSGMYISDSKGTNNGLISINDVYYGHGVQVNGGEFENSSTGKIEIDGISGATAIYAYTNSYVGDENQEKSTSIINNGILSVSGSEYLGGINGYGSNENNQLLEVVNNGIINVTGDFSKGIEVTNGNLINTGEINLDGKHVTALSISGSGKLINTKDLNLSGVAIRGNSFSDNREIIIENEGNLIVTGDGEVIKDSINNSHYSHNAAIGIYSYGGNIFNSGNILATGNGAYLEYENDWGETSSTSSMAAKGIFIENARIVKNEGDITVKGNGINSWHAATGIYASGKSTYDPSTGSSIYEKVNVENSGAIKVDGDYATGIKVENGDLINTGKIDVTGTSSVGISSSTYYDSTTTSKIENEGDITVTGDGEVIKSSYDSNYYYSTDAAKGINSTDTDVYNSGNIVATGNGAYLEYEADWGTTSTSSKAAQGIYAANAGIVKNEGNITVTGDGIDLNNGAIGIYASGKYNYDTLISEKVNVENSGMINVIGTYATGIKVETGDLINTGKIEVEGNNSTGIKISGTDSTAINLGTINIDGEGSYGMYAEYGTTITNGATGIINVGASAAGGMYADWNSTAINDGTINIHKDNAGGESIALVGDGTLENNGTITADTDLTINTISGGAYVIGTSEDGSYGKINAKNVSIDGDVVVSAGITKNGFKNEYTMQNVVDAEDIKLGDNFNFTSNSLLYDAEAITDRWGNLDATLSRNDKVLSDFTKGYITSTANIFEKYQNEEAIKALSADAKEVIKAIDTTSVESIDETLNALTPTIYANLGRQILETSETFKEQDMVAINSLGENSYNFTFIGEYQDVDSRDNIEGYKSKMTGFVGAMNFGDGTFGTIGYGYNDVDYKDNGKGHIQTIHLGLNRFGKYEGVDYNFGIGGEYNFHENKRDIDLLGRKAESDFDSYGVRASGEVSKIFGEKAYVKPYLGLDLAHMKYDSFTESNANSLNANVESENYTSVLPKVGFVVGDKFGALDLFAGVEYSYELGNMDKEQNFSYEGFEGTGKLPKDNLESGTTGVKAGASYEVNNFTLGASVGKNFGRRDNSFASLSLGYTF